MPIDDTELWVVERGPDDGVPLLVLHGGPGSTTTSSPTTWTRSPTEACGSCSSTSVRAGDRSRPPPATWRLERYAQDVVMLARALGLDRYAVLGHSFGAFVALQAAVDFPGTAAATVISSGVPSARFLEHVDDDLRAFEPVALRERVAASWAREPDVSTADEFDRLMRDQMPFHFADPLDPRIEDYLIANGGHRLRARGPAPLLDRRRRCRSRSRTGSARSSIPVLVLAGRHDRTCAVDAAEAIAAGVPDAQLLVLEASRSHDVRRGAGGLRRGGVPVPRCGTTSYA